MVPVFGGEFLNILSPWPVKDLQLLFPWSCVTPTTLLILNHPKGSSKAGHGSVGYAGKHQALIDGIVRNLKFLGEDGSILTAGKSGKVPPGQIKGGGMGGGGAEKFQYFYHPDHLGSTSYITDASGEVYQHLEYFAFGGTFVEEHSNTDRVPYLFNGKELDEETGLYYYGARYYDAQTSVFLSVDPLAEKYNFQSPYAYAVNNPVRYIDVLGMGPGDPNSQQEPAGDKENKEEAENYVTKVGKMIVEDMSADANAVKKAVSEWAKNVPILGDLTGKGEKVGGDRMHFTSGFSTASPTRTESKSGNAPETKIDLLLAAMGAAAPEIPEPGSLNFAEMIGKVSGIIDVAGDMKEPNSKPNQSDTLYTHHGGASRDSKGNLTTWSEIVVGGDTVIIQKRIK